MRSWPASDGVRPRASSTDVIGNLRWLHTHASDGADWKLVAGDVKGGYRMEGRAVKLSRAHCHPHGGEVSLTNNGRFILIALNLAVGGTSVDTSCWSGLATDLFANDKNFDMHPQTTDLTGPGQSCCRCFVATPGWQTRRPFFETLDRTGAKRRFTWAVCIA